MRWWIRISYKLLARRTAQALRAQKAVGVATEMLLTEGERVWAGTCAAG